MADYLSLERLQKRFGALEVTRELSLAIAKSEIVALLGPSGSGKTTVLRLIAGFEQPESGRVVVEGQDVTAVPPERRRFGMVFQHYALFPHMTVGENVAFGLEAQGLTAGEIPRRVSETLAVVDLSGFEERRVTQLSGGQQQRVAVARALAPSPRVLLLDEPLSNLDPTLRDRTRRELKRLIRRVGITTVLVTHEQEEAFELGDRVAVMNCGRLEQVGSPEQLYDRPATRFVATFVGRSNVFEGTWQDGTVRLAEGVAWPAEARDGVRSGAPVEVVVRPGALTLSAPAPGRALAGEVVERRYAGSDTFVLVRLDSGREVEVEAGRGAGKPGDRVHVAPAPGSPPPPAFPREAE
jgi:ABC-type Fe3+/spermidine/putrescine transport system ATPase subunit